MDWKNVQELRKQGSIPEGKKLAYELLEADPSDFRTRSMLEWLIYDEMKPNFKKAIEAVKADKRPQQADLGRIDQALNEFTRLPAQRPGMGCSVLLQQLCRIGPEYPRFAGFVRWVGIDGLRQEDWSSQSSNDGTWPPLVVLVARALTKWTKARDTSMERLEETLQWLNAATPVAEGDDALWLRWDKAGVLRRLERYEEAARALSSVIKAKRSDFWVWAEAGRLYQADDPDLALACFCQALLCPSSPEFVAKAHRELAELLAECGNHSQACVEIGIAASAREEQGWRLGDELESLMREPWFEPTPSDAQKPKDFYAAHAPLALSLCFDEVETRPASFLGVLNLPQPRDAKPGWKPRPRTRFAVLTEDGKSVSTLGPHHRKVPWKLGEAVSLVVGRQEGQADETIVQIIRRSDGQPWDCTAPGRGVVAREASDNRPMQIFAGRDLGDVPADTGAPSDEKIRLGDGVSFGLTTNPKNGRVDAYGVGPAPLPDIDVKQIQGRLRRAESMAHAFVEDVFVPPHVVETVPEHVDEVGVVAVYARHPKREGYSWRAVRISAAS
ncbi:tetratricopeptide repeat protein [Luteimonas sp. MC1828]|uniref:tetratricopeptide repeat protein n=1 Tax=Luteimonas sp. MC1828 TaxID=2799787 RepID=UPI0018F25692|nr:tetratricopeptide repeat protein [Luteimonas sp. MC1828]MBJ7574540.1 tetratricopeptide repeat protein [Luteimonas sp. MC1828]